MHLAELLNYPYGQPTVYHDPGINNNDTNYRAGGEGAMGAIESLSAKISYARLITKYQDINPYDTLLEMMEFIGELIDQEQYFDQEQFFDVMREKLVVLNHYADDESYIYEDDIKYFHPLEVAFRYIKKLYTSEMTADTHFLDLIKEHRGGALPTTFNRYFSANFGVIILNILLVYWAAASDGTTVDLSSYVVRHEELSTTEILNLRAMLLAESEGLIELDRIDIANIHFKLRQWEDAITIFQQLHNDALYDESLLEQIGHCYTMLGNTEMAKKYYQDSNVLNRRIQIVKAVYEVARGNNMNVNNFKIYESDNLAPDSPVCLVGFVTKLCEKLAKLHPLVHLVLDMKDDTYHSVLTSIAKTYKKMYLQEDNSLKAGAPSLEEFKQRIQAEYIRYVEKFPNDALSSSEFNEITPNLTTPNRNSTPPRYLTKMLQAIYNDLGGKALPKSVLNYLDSVMRVIEDDEKLPEELNTSADLEAFNFYLNQDTQHNVNTASLRYDRELFIRALKKFQRNMLMHFFSADLFIGGIHEENERTRSIIRQGLDQLKDYFNQITDKLVPYDRLFHRSLESDSDAEDLFVEIATAAATAATAATTATAASPSISPISTSSSTVTFAWNISFSGGRIVEHRNNDADRRNPRSRNPRSRNRRNRHLRS